MATEKNAEKILVPQPETIPPKPEKIVSPEIRMEQTPVSPEKMKEAAQPQERKGEGRLAVGSTQQTYQQRRAQEIDNILAEGLHEVFLKMDPQKQKEFKEKGEETVMKINKLLDKTKVKISQIIDLIKKWLHVIPGVNKFFLEQEAKIKADRIMRIKNKF